MPSFPLPLTDKQCLFYLYMLIVQHLYWNVNDDFLFLQLSATNSMHAELIEDDGESRYKVTDIIGTFMVTHAL